MDTPKTPQLSLTDFLDEVTSSIDSGHEISIAAVFAHAETYPELREYFLKKPETVTEILLDPKTAPQKIRDLFSRPRDILAEIAPKEAQKLTQFTEPEQRFAQSFPVREVTPVREKAWEDLVTQERVRLAKRIAKNRVKTQQFFSKLHKIRAYGTPEAEKEVKKIEEKIHLKTFEEIRNELIEEARRRGNSQDVEQTRAVIEEFAPTFTAPDFSAPILHTARTAKAVLEHPDITNTTVLSESIARGDTADAALRLSRIATVVEHPVQNIQHVPLKNAFEDVVTTVFPNRREAIDRVFTATWNTTTKAESFIGNMTNRLGEDVVSSREFKEFIEQGNTYVRGRGAGGGAFTNAFSGMFSAPQAPDPDMEDYLEALYKKVGERTYSSDDFFGGKAYANDPQHFHFEIGESPLSLIFRFGVKEEAAASAAGTAARTGLGAWSKESIKKLGTNFLLKMGVPAGSRLVALAGGPVGWVVFAVTIVLPYVWDWVKGRLNSVMGAFSGGLLSGVRAASDGFAANWAAFLQSYSRYKDPVPQWMIILALVASPILVVLPITSLIPSSASQTQVRRSAMLPIGGGGYQAPDACDPVTDPTCVPLFCDPTKQSCDWPTPCGCITQGPNSGGSHSDLNAIDAGTNNSTICNRSYDGNPPSAPPAYAMCDGTISNTYFGLGDGQICKDFTSPTCGFGYGNFVYLNCNDGKTQFLYSHLLKPGPGISTGASVRKRQILGYVDNNGNSTGPHLHFEYRGINGASVQSIEKILPPEYAIGYCWSD